MISHLTRSSLGFPHRFMIQTLLLMVFALPLASAKATPITFRFTGTVSEYILANGSLWKGGATSPDWYGKPVTGSLTIDLALAVDRSSAGDPSAKLYGPEWNDDPNRASWVSWSLVGPDAVHLDIPAATIPTPGPDTMVDALVSLKLPTATRAYSEFYVQRWIDFFPDYPKMAMEINLATRDGNANPLINGLDLANLQVQPQAANYHNYGTVFYYTDAGDAYEYNFTLDSFWRATSAVPEPANGIVALLALGGLMVRRRFA